MIEVEQLLQAIDVEVPADLEVDSCSRTAGTQRTPAIEQLAAAHPRFVLALRRDSSSWLNLVERWFAELTTKQLRRGAHRSVRALNDDIRALDRRPERRQRSVTTKRDRVTPEPSSLAPATIAPKVSR